MPVITSPMFSVMWYMFVTDSGSYSLSGTCDGEGTHNLGGRLRKVSVPSHEQCTRATGSCSCVALSSILVSGSFHYAWPCLKTSALSL